MQKSLQDPRNKIEIVGSEKYGKCVLFSSRCCYLLDYGLFFSFVSRLHFWIGCIRVIHNEPYGMSALFKFEALRYYISNKQMLHVLHKWHTNQIIRLTENRIRFPIAWKAAINHIWTWQYYHISCQHFFSFGYYIIEGGWKLHIANDFEIK